jgi:hypothetical protein
LSKEFKKDANPGASDFEVYFLDIFDECMNLEQLAKLNLIEQQSRLIMFVRVIKVLLKNKIIKEFFEKAVVQQFLYIMTYGAQIDELVEISIFSSQMIFNIIGVEKTSEIIESFFTLVVNAYLRFKDKNRIKRYT